MNISYGPPGHKGVTTLMAVGDDELEAHPLEAAVKTGGYVALGVWALGLVMKSKTVQNVGFGAGLALFAVQAVANSAKVKTVTVPAPVPAATGCIGCII